jgi:hypothetical protein
MAATDAPRLIRRSLFTTAMRHLAGDVRPHQGRLAGMGDALELGAQATK